MKILTSLIIVLFPLITFAGGGGGLRPDVAASKTGTFGGTGGGGIFSSTNGGGILSTTEVVFHQGEQNGFVKFSYGQLVDNQWQIQSLDIPKVDLELDLVAMKALELSKIQKSWVEIK